MKSPKLLFVDILLTVGVSLLFIISLKNSEILPRCHITNFISYKINTPLIVKGFISSEPEEKGGKTSFLFKTEAMQEGNFNHSCCGTILVNFKGQEQLFYGEELILYGNLHRPFGKANTPIAGYNKYLYNQGIYLLMRVKSGPGIIKLHKNKGLILRRFAFWIKHNIQKMISRNTSKLTAAVLEAMILGEKDNIPWFVNHSMMRTGTLHILVVSGFNVGVIFFLSLLLLKIARIPRRARFVIAIPVLIIYCLITGASNPVMRATIMALIFIAAYLIKREPNIYHALAVAAASILILNPRQLFDVGFQLSFISVISIVYFYPKLRSLLSIELLKAKPLKLFLDSCLVSFSAWLGTMGFIAYYFGTFSPVTVLANIFIVPLATLITLSGISLVILGSIFPASARIFANSSELEVFVLLKINAFFANLPFAQFTLP